MPAVKIGLMNDAVTENLPIFFGVEVKKTNGDIDDAEVQLKTFFYAFFKRLEYIEVFLERTVDLAALGVLVHGHTWVPYVACRDGTELVRSSFHLPIARRLTMEYLQYVERLGHAITHTETFLGVSTTISFLDRIRAYIEAVLWPAYHKQIIIPLAEKLAIHSTVSPC